MKKFFILAIIFFLLLLLGFFWREAGEMKMQNAERKTRIADAEERSVETENGQNASQEVVPSIAEEKKHEEKLATITDHTVPFVVQAPDGDWKNPRYQDGCEEATALMALRWAEGKTIADAKRELGAISRDMEKKLGTFHDTSISDTFAYAKTQLGTGSVTLEKNATTQTIRDAILHGSIVAVTVDGRKLGNPNFTPPGPAYHMLLVRGYDSSVDAFITNDPGTRRGEGYRYNANVLFSAMQTYDTGHHGPVHPEDKTILVFSRS